MCDHLNGGHTTRKNNLAEDIARQANLDILMLHTTSKSYPNHGTLRLPNDDDDDDDDDSSEHGRHVQSDNDFNYLGSIQPNCS